MSQERIQDELYKQAAEYGGGEEGWKKALRESAMRMVVSGEIQGYWAFTGPKRLYEKTGFGTVAQRGDLLVMRKKLK